MPDVLRNYNEHKSFVLALFKGRSLNPRDPVRLTLNPMPSGKRFVLLRHSPLKMMAVVI